MEALESPGVITGLAQGQVVQAETLGVLGMGRGSWRSLLTETGDFCPDLVCCKCSGLSLLLTPKELANDPKKVGVLLGFIEMERASSN